MYKGHHQFDQVDCNLVPRLSFQCIPLSLDHVTTQNLGGNKICWVGGVKEYSDCGCGKLGRFQNLEKLLKTTGSIGVQSQIFADEECYIYTISAVSKI